MTKSNRGKVFLVGAGPGDPGLLTLKGKACLEQADIVLYDHLANPALLRHARESAERVYVGRRGRGQYQNQDDINKVMIERARAGQVVVRLKGGDPFVFGRGGEEAEAVAEAQIDFEVVPGVTAAVAVPAYAGIPVTHRTMASTVTIVTGHEDPSKPSPVMDWPKLAATSGTLVFMMGMKTLPAIVSRLLQEGRASDTPVAAIRWGTRAEQQTVIGSLRDIVAKAERARFEPPTVIIVGNVVKLREQLNWFERRPLFGKRVLLTRPKEQAHEFARLLTAFGAETIEVPVIQIIPPPTWTIVDQAISRLQAYHWLIVTSVNGVRPFMDRLRAAGKDVRALGHLRICAIGPRTADALATYGLTADLIPAEYQAEGILASLSEQEMKGKRILIPRAEIAREILPQQLSQMGAQVDVVPVYRTIAPGEDANPLAPLFEDRKVDVVTFTSSSTVRNFVELIGGRDEARRLTVNAIVGCIGPVTAQTAEECGLTVTIMPPENTVPALAEAIVKYFAEGARVAVSGA
ncbi:Porphyrin biosynthesis protein HemD [Nitrospira sp. KM1]|uniref:uroporphyrinogen-III C-methyltransferase n=1 Tax=Nitrospira sp. KM1 TaxID=1936990 RepID=UPI0013A76672|nr:uroporphyrinogen-III C-methyltransferase [Nitrospira sp. KM1]BCA53673.1 Porphyrin biosynthesis protein HemD [Nitrospira sp. KM1]